MLTCFLTKQIGDNNIDLGDPIILISLPFYFPYLYLFLKLPVLLIQ